MVKIGLIDCGLGNLKSVYNAFEKLGCEVEICSSPHQLANSRHLVLPGVGAFGEGIAKLRTKGFDQAIIEAANSGSRILGICLGMQFLFDKSYEFGEHQGLGLIPGEVREMKVSAYGLRIPHIGWNETPFIKKDNFLEGLPNPSCFYYVNSYACHCSNPENVLAKYEYGENFTAIVRKGSVVGVQFHPEKSHRDGLKLLRQFIKL